MLDAEIAQTLTFEQLSRWIVEGHRREPLPAPQQR